MRMIPTYTIWTFPRILPKSVFPKAAALVVAKVSRTGERTHTCLPFLTYLFHRDVGGDFARSLCSVSLSPPLLSYTLRPFFKCLMLSLIWWILSHWSKGKAISCTWHLTNMPGLISSELKAFFQYTTCVFGYLWNNQKNCHFCNKLEPLKAFILTWQFWNISKDLLGLRPWIELEDKPRRTMENAALTQTGSTLIPLRRKSAEENRKDGVTYF